MMTAIGGGSVAITAAARAPVEAPLRCRDLSPRVRERLDGDGEGRRAGPGAWPDCAVERPIRGHGAVLAGGLGAGWHRRGVQPTVPALDTNRGVMVFGSTEVLGRGRVEVIGARQDSAGFVRYLEAVDERQAATGRQVYLVLDDGSCHTSKTSRSALAERAAWLHVVWLSRYSPQLYKNARWVGSASLSLLPCRSGSSPATAGHRPADHPDERRARRTPAPMPRGVRTHQRLT